MNNLCLYQRKPANGPVKQKHTFILNKMAILIELTDKLDAI